MPRHLTQEPTMPAAIQVGDTVRLKRGVTGLPIDGREDNRTAVVQSLLKNVPGGLFMARDQRCCRYWNVADVERVPVAGH
jgi:hypothetical protein